MSDCKPYDSFVVHLNSITGKRNKMGLLNKREILSNNTVNTYSFQRRSGFTEATKYMYIVLLTVHLQCALQRQHKTLFIRNDHNDQNRLKMGTRKNGSDNLKGLVTPAFLTAKFQKSVHFTLLNM